MEPIGLNLFCFALNKILFFFFPNQMMNRWVGILETQFWKMLKIKVEGKDAKEIHHLFLEVLLFMKSSHPLKATREKETACVLFTGKYMVIKDIREAI